MKKAKILAVAVIALMVIAPKATALEELGWTGIGLMTFGGGMLIAGAVTSVTEPPDSMMPGAFYALGGVSAGFGLVLLLMDVALNSFASADNPDGIYLVSDEESAGRRNKPVFDILRHLAVVPLREKVFVGASYSY